MRIKDNTEIGGYTTFGLPCTAEEFFVARTSQDIVDFCKTHDDFFVLGGGSNIILPKTLEFVLKIENKGIEILNEYKDEVYIKIASGEVWDDVVAFAVSNNYAGIEMLSAIPGTAGGTPYQNVGAYGGEIANTFIELTAYDRLQKEIVILKKDDCKFGYRTSIFKKGTYKGRYVIIDFTLKLSKGPVGVPNYPDVVKYFADKPRPTLQEIRNAIIEIRWNKLPKPEEIPNCGSFFENPIVESDVAEKIKKEFPEMNQLKTYPVDDKHVKISAGFLIEHAGLKGKDFGHVGTYAKNALVLTNRGGANQEDVIAARDEIIKTVKDKFGVELHSEPEII